MCTHYMTEMIIRVLDTLRLCFRRTIYKLPYSNIQRRLMHHVLFITAYFFHFLSLTIYFHFKTRKKQTQNKKQIWPVVFCRQWSNRDEVVYTFYYIVSVSVFFSCVSFVQMSVYVGVFCEMLYISLTMIRAPLQHIRTCSCK